MLLTMSWLFACAEGPSADTLITDLRVVAVDADRPEVAPGEPVTFTSTIADPEQTGADVVSWTCTAFGPPGSACAEASVAWGLGTPTPWMASDEPVDERVNVDFVAPMAVASVLSDEVPSRPTSVWTLACEPGLCPFIDRFRDGLDAGVVSDDLAADLTDPDRWMAALPFSGVSLTRRSLWVSLNAPEARNNNPVLSVELPATLTADEPVDVLVSAEDPDGDPLQIFPYATAGGFGLPQIPLDGEPSAPVALYGPADADGNVRVYVTVTDERGGTASWAGSLPVAP